MRLRKGTDFAGLTMCEYPMVPCHADDKIPERIFH